MPMYLTVKNKIIFQDEIEPNETYLWRTGQPVGSIFGYVADGFYGEEDFTKEGALKDGLPVPDADVQPGDIKYKDLNNDHVINEDDQCNFSSLVSFDWRSTIDTFDIKCTGDVGMEDLPESQIWV